VGANCFSGRAQNILRLNAHGQREEAPGDDCELRAVPGAESVQRSKAEAQLLLGNSPLCADIVDKGFSELGARTSLESSSLGPKIVELRFMKLT
jgi:hypothetical protein